MPFSTSILWASPYIAQQVRTTIAATVVVCGGELLQPACCSPEGCLYCCHAVAACGNITASEGVLKQQPALDGEEVAEVATGDHTTHGDRDCILSGTKQSGKGRANGSVSTRIPVPTKVPFGALDASNCSGTGHGREGQLRQRAWETPVTLG